MLTFCHSKSQNFNFMNSFQYPFLLSLCFHLLRTSLPDPRAIEAGRICLTNKAPLSQRQAFVSNFLAALEAMLSRVIINGYGSTIIGKGNLSVYGFGRCMKDVNGSDCDLCFAQIKTRIDKCLPYERLTRGGRVFFDGCYLRYDDHDFSGEILSNEDKTVCGLTRVGGNNYVFKRIVVDLMKNLSVQGVKNGGFSFGSLKGKNVSVYGLVQCWEFVNSSACRTCLGNGVSRISLCPPMDEGRVLNSGCYLRYSTYKFYNNSGPPPLIVSHGASHLAVVLATVPSTLAFLILLAFAIFVATQRYIRKQKEMKQLGSNSKLNYTYETLEEATNYFHESNKLGQGGSGSVYKGKLPDGTIVAVKRLFYNTRQWVDQFFNEIDLISNIQHKNLVKLLGCSITGPESLLVYEFIPNQSLNCHLFGKKDVEPLSWEERYKIILGTAEGLAYLHEESKLRIIHRDIKLSNILLDHDMTPKIADFGLVRLLPRDKSHLSTAIAGTLGYMAPEYIVYGRLTEKADVYSFGVILIEIITRMKNTNSMSQDSMCMLHKIWSLHARGKLHKAVDGALGGNFRESEASRMLQIGLLCVQANAELRPSMSTTVKMLRDKEFQLLEPTQPPFLSNSSSEITRQIQHQQSSHSLVASRSTRLVDDSSAKILIDDPQASLLHG